MKTPVLIVGGGCGGVAAALALSRRGIACVLTEPTDWLGGQLTAQAVPPDEHPWIECAGQSPTASSSYLDYRQRVRRWYREHRPLTASASQNLKINPGGGWVSHLCHEPRVGAKVIFDMLAPGIAAGLIDVRLCHRPVAAETDGDYVRSVRFEDTQAGNTLEIEADYVLDASELGDVLALAQVEHDIGSDGQKRYGEMHAARPDPDPTDQQAFCWCFALEHRPGEDHTISKPAGYAHWADYRPALSPPWPGRLFSWDILGHGGQTRTLAMADPGGPDPEQWELWRYRRISDARIYQPEHRVDYPEVSLVNWVQMDYFRKPLLGVGVQDQELAMCGAKEQSLAFLYWLQTAAPRPDGGTGWPGLKLRGDELGTEDGFAKSPYIREARRLRAQLMVTEAHVGVEQRLNEGAKATPNGRARVATHHFDDAVGIGSYHLDLHPTTGGFSGMYVESCPYEIPLRSLIPLRVRNLLAAGKCLGVSHLANGCFRLHPTEWAVGEAAGTAAALLCEISEPVQRLGHHIPGIQARLTEFGSPLRWPNII